MIRKQCYTAKTQTYNFETYKKRWHNKQTRVQTRQLYWQARDYPMIMNRQSQTEQLFYIPCKAKDLLLKRNDKNKISVMRRFVKNNKNTISN